MPLFPEIPFNCFTLSISSPPIFPNPHDPQPNQPPLPFYQKVFHQLHNHAIHPLLTISHYQIPLALVKNYRGWTNRKLLD
ncbi:family 1 glycosylhydrolase, partial [Bacillus sp. WP8]|uniref:family 1 glycosylhydrolase n=1 Tax=Bacillus sp. WP8 TaxID=756828 RepID=UPI0028CB8A5F